MSTETSNAAAPSDPVQPWAISPDETAEHWQSDLQHGLTSQEAELRLRKHGPNELGQHLQRHWSTLFLAQFLNMMVALLIAAAVISGLIGEWTDAILIGLIVIANAVVGFSQEWTAERAIESLRRMAQPVAKVNRGGQWQQIPAAQLAPGDLVEIKTGDLVPADGRLVEVTELETSEASLTGESHPIEKSVDALGADTVLPDRTCMVFAGTSVVAGHGLAVLTHTGSETELGRIAQLLHTAKPATTPLQQRLDKLSKQLTILIVAIAAIVFVVGIRQHGLGPMLLTAVGLAVAALPEGLPAVITIGLAVGAKRMARRQAVIRRLTAVETLGSVNVICSDKTGTLTQNKMSVVSCHPSAESPDNYDELLRAAVLCNDATLDDRGSPVGSPTEAAFLVAAIEKGIEVDQLRSRYSRVAEIPFSSTMKRMATLHRFDDGEHVLYVKGAVERILPNCERMARKEGPVPSDQIQSVVAELAGKGQRVLALAQRTWRVGEQPPESSAWEQSLDFLGFIALADPIRTEVPKALEQCRSAGIQTILITGDHPETARSIAGQLGIWQQGQQVLTGVELDKMSDDDLKKVIGQTTVYARVAPEHKLRIVRCHQSLGSVTAMTGDGVNDAPALKQADIGIAMGEKGTDVAKDASAMVLADDNFATIVAAVEEGRAVYDNIRKSIAYLFAGNTAEVLLLFAAVVLGLPLPLFPIQILWINLVTDGIPALAMAFEPPEAATMRRRPRRRSEGLFSGGLGWGVILVGSTVAFASLILFRMLLPADANEAQIATAQTAVFMTLAMAELIFAMSARDLSRSVNFKGVVKNRSLLAAIIVGTLLQLAVCYVPFLQPIFHTVALSARDLAICVGVATSGFLAMEAWKLVQSWRHPPSDAAIVAEPEQGKASSAGIAGAEHALT